MCDQRKVARRALLLSLAVLGLATASIGAQAPAVAAAPAIIAVNVPADAEVWFDDHKMPQRGTQRRYTSPALPTADRAYFYDVRVRWMENGQLVERTRKIYFRAGDQVRMQFHTSQEQAAYRANPNQRSAPSAYYPATGLSGTVGGTSYYLGTVAPANNNTATIITSVPPPNTSGGSGTVVVPAVPLLPQYNVAPNIPPQTGDVNNPTNPGTLPGFQPNSGIGNLPSNAGTPTPSPTAQPSGTASRPNQSTGSPQGSSPTAQPPGPASTPNQATGSPQGSSPTAQPTPNR